MPQMTVGTNAVPIANQGTNSLYLINLGPGELYYSKEASVSTASGTPLDVGNAVQDWPSQTPMYVVSKATSNVAYENNGSGIAIGATKTTVVGNVSLTPGTSVTLDAGTQVDVTGAVSVSGPVALAAGTQVALSGPVSVSGPVSLEAGTSVSINNSSVPVSGSVSLNAPVELASGTGVQILNSEVPISGAVSISGPITLASGSTVAISGSVTIAAGNNTIGSVSVSGPVSLVTGTEVNIANSSVPVTGNVGITGPVSLAAGTAVDVSGSVSVSGPVSLAAGSSVTIANSSVPVSGAVSISGPITLAAGSTVAISGAVSIAAGTNNIGSVSVSGPVSLVTGTEVNIANSSVPVTGNVGITGPVSFAAGSQVAISGPVSLATGSNTIGAVSVSGPVSLVTGTQVTIANSTVPVSGNVGITGPVSLASGTSVSVSGSVSLSGPVTLASGSTVAISGPVTVSGTVTANLAAGSQVNITSGTVDIGQVNGGVNSQPSSNLTTLATPGYGVPAGTASTSISATVDLSLYSSVMVALGYATTVAGGPPDQTNYVRVRILQYSGANQTGIVTEDYAQFLLCDAQEQIFHVPVRGLSAVIQVDINKNTATSAGGTFTAYVLGSHEVISLNRYANIINDTTGVAGSIGGIGFYKHINGASTFAISSKNGLATFSVLADNSTSGGSANVQAYEDGASHIIIGSGGIPTGGQVSVQIELPQRPIFVACNATGSSVLDISLVQS